MTNCVDNHTSILSKCQSEVRSRFQHRKEESLRLSDLYSALDLRSRSYRVKRCGDFLEFHANEEEIKLHSANFCKDRLCPTCNWRRSKKIFSQVSKVMNELENQKFRFLFLTLTVRNCQFYDLETTVDQLIKGWRRLYKSNKIKNKIFGSFHALEITVNKKDCTFHPHLHCILAVQESYFHKGYISQKNWSELWRSCCDLEYVPVVHVQAIKKGKLDSEIEEFENRSFKSAVKEVSKYVAKGSEYLSDSFEENLVRVQYLLEAISGRRLCSFTGVFKESAKKLRLDDMENGDLVHTGDLERLDLGYVVIRFRWNVGFYENISDDRQSKGEPGSYPARLACQQ